MGVMAVAAVVMAVGAIMQGQAQSKAAKEAARREEALGRERQSIAEENARRVEAEGMEESRRLSAQKAKEEAAARAAAAASGAYYLGDDEDALDSITLSLRDQKAENARQIDWQKLATASQASLVRRQGAYTMSEAEARAAGYKSEAKAAQMKGWMGAASSLASAYGGGAFGSIGGATAAAGSAGSYGGGGISSGGVGWGSSGSPWSS